MGLAIFLALHASFRAQAWHGATGAFLWVSLPIGETFDPTEHGMAQSDWGNGKVQG